MAQTDRIVNVAIVGASGRVGAHIAKELVKTGQHKVIALSRAESKGKFPDGVTRVEVDYDDDASLAAALKDQQILIITLATTAPKGTSTRLVKAALAAGIQFIMPNSWGPNVENDALVNNDPDLVAGMCRANCDEVKALGGTYIALASGFWFEYSLAFGSMTFGIDILKKEATLFDDGKQHITTSTLPQCGRAVAGLLSLPVEKIKEWSNKPIYLNSFRVSQRDMLDSVHRVMKTSDSDWKITYEPTKERYQQGMTAMKSGDRAGFTRVMYSRAFYPSGDCDTMKKSENEKLGLKGEDLDEWTKWVVDEINKGWSPMKEMGME